MAPSPFRRRRKASRLARNLALAEAALALAKSRAGGAGSAVKGRGRLLIAGAAVLAAGVGAAVLGREKVARVLPSRAGGDEAPSAPAPPQQSNYDAPGPVANTATPVPAPDPATRPAAAGEPPRPAIDERAEEEAAAAEAAAIGGPPREYAGVTPDSPADEAERPVVEAGGGEAEGQEQAEAELASNATLRDQAPSDAERQIDDALEAQDQPASGETPEPLAPADERVENGPEGLVPSAGEEGGGISGRPGARLEDASETPGVPPTGSPATEPRTGDDEDPSRT